MWHWQQAGNGYLNFKPAYNPSYQILWSTKYSNRVKSSQKSSEKFEDRMHSLEKGVNIVCVFFQFFFSISVSLLILNMFVAKFALAPCKTYCQFFCLSIQNGDTYTASELPCKQIEKSNDLYFLVTYFKTVISCIRLFF